MSLNRVLNRPMFRREALRRGVLKPIKAQSGEFVMVPGTSKTQNVARQQMVPYKGGSIFGYDPVSGSYINQPMLKYKAGNFGRSVGRFGRGLGLSSAMYTGLASLSPEAAMALGGAELLGLGVGMSKKPGMQLASRILTGPSRLMFTRPGLSTVGLAAYGTAKGFFDQAKEKELVKEYAKANNISEERALNIFARDIVGEGRPITSFRLSDIPKTINKYMQPSISGAMKYAKPLSDKTAPGQKSEKDIAREMRSYFDYVKGGGGRVYQDIDTLVKNYKEADAKTTYKDTNEEIMIPDDEMNQESKNVKLNNEAQFAADSITAKIMLEEGVTLQKAQNIAAAIVEGKINSNEIKKVVRNEDEYGELNNYSGDPNHPKAVKFAKTNEEIIKNEGAEGAEGTNITEKAPPTGDNEIDRGKEIADKIDVVSLLQNPRDTETDPQRVFMLKLAAGLLSGKTMKGGLGGFAEVFGAALGPAVDAKVLVKMKNDEAYRDWATTVLSYNAELIKSRNNLVKLNKIPGSFQMRSGEFVEAFRDKETGNVFVLDPAGNYIPADQNQGQFFETKTDAKYFDNLKLIADGYMSTRLLSDSILLMETKQGKTAIGASGLITNLVDIVSKLPTELKDGLFSTGTFSQTNTIDPEMSDKEFEKFKKRSDKALKNLEDGFEEFIKTNPSASDVLGKLRVNARMLTYSLANSLKEKDRLTNRDLELIEDLTKTLTTSMTDDKIIAQYKELLKEVTRKNNIRIANLGTMGYTEADIKALLGSSGLGVYAEERIQKQPEVKTLEDAFNLLMGVQ